MALIFSSHPLSFREVDAFIWNGQIAKKEKMRMMCPWLVIVLVYVFWKRTMGKEGLGLGGPTAGVPAQGFFLFFLSKLFESIPCHSYKIMPFQYGSGLWKTAGIIFAWFLFSWGTVNKLTAFLTKREKNNNNERKKADVTLHWVTLLSSDTESQFFFFTINKILSLKKL